MPRRRLLLPLLLAAGLALACSALTPGTPTPTNPPSTLTPTHALTPTPSDTHTPTPPPSPTLPPALDGIPLPRLAAGSPLTLTTLNMSDALNGWAIGLAPGNPHDHILRTADGGDTWRDVSPPQPEAADGASQAAAAYFAGQSAWVAYQDRDFSTAPFAYVWRTADGGDTWTPSQPLDLGDMEFFTISDLHFAGPQAGWLVAHVGAGMNHDYVVVFATRDGGAFWQRLVDPFDIREDNLQMSCLKTGLGFLSADTGWVTGDCSGVAPGYFLQRTDDGGRTWRVETLPPPPEMPDAFARQDGGCGTYNPVRIESAPPQFLIALSCITYGETLVTQHFLYSTADGDLTWQVQPLPARDYAWLNRQEGWAIEPQDFNDPAAPRRIYHTTDGGATWAEVTTVAWTADLDFTSTTAGWAIARSGEETALVRSEDGGASWEIVEAEVGP